jgi:hypothetical protein
MKQLEQAQKFKNGILRMLGKEEIPGSIFDTRTDLEYGEILKLLRELA